MKNNTEDYIFIPEGRAYCFDERKTEIAETFEKSNDLFLREVEGYLLAYRAVCKLLEMNRYERTYFGEAGRSREDALEESESYLQARLFEIRSFVLSMSECDEKLFLYYHYIHGESIARCAELLDISRATAYRLKCRALRAAAEHYGKMRGAAM